MKWIAQEIAIFLLAVQFFTRLPLPQDVRFTPERLVAAPRHHPLVGALIGAARGLAPAFDPRLVEMDFGAWEGRPWADIPRAEIDAWASDFQHARPHGGESVAALSARVLAALNACHASFGDTLIVTHAGVICAALQDWRAEIAFGAWRTIA